MSSYKVRCRASSADYYIELANPELRKQKFQLLYREGYYAKKS